jgi:hypothetical protein
MWWGKDFYVPFVAPVHSTQSNFHPLPNLENSSAKRSFFRLHKFLYSSCREGKTCTHAL